jgi:hypothetical protein
VSPGYAAILPHETEPELTILLLHDRAAVLATVVMLGIMETVKHGFVAPALGLALALAFGLARAQAAPPAAPVAQEAGAGVMPPPARKPINRRPVWQLVEPTPPIVTDGYRPTLTVRPPAVPGAAPAQAPPVRMNACDAGGCFDSGGARFNRGAGAGVGSTLLSPKGQLCIEGAVNTQCF